MSNQTRTAFIVYVDLKPGWMAEKIASTRRQLQEGLEQNMPELNAEVSYVPAELHPLVTDANK